jgi:hypothetical protein
VRWWMAFQVATGRQNDLTPGFSATPDCANGWCSLCMDETRGRVTVPHGTYLPSLMLCGRMPAESNGREDAVSLRRSRGSSPVFSVGGSTTMVHTAQQHMGGGLRLRRSRERCYRGSQLRRSEWAVFEGPGAVAAGK